MQLEFEFDYRVTLKAPVEIASSFYGKRMYWQIESGRVRGKRIDGVLEGGSDWMIDAGDRFWRPHVRTQIRTRDGAYLGMHYDGLVEKSDAFLNAIRTNSGTSWEITTSASVPSWNPRIATSNGSIRRSSSKAASLLRGQSSIGSTG